MGTEKCMHFSVFSLSFSEIKQFLILCLVSIHLKISEKFFLEKHKKFFWGGFFFVVFWAWGWKVRQIAPVSTTLKGIFYNNFNVFIPNKWT